MKLKVYLVTYNVARIATYTSETEKLTPDLCNQIATEVTKNNNHGGIVPNIRLSYDPLVPRPDEDALTNKWFIQPSELGAKGLTNINGYWEENTMLQVIDYVRKFDSDEG